MEWPKLLNMHWTNIPWLRTDSDIQAAGEEIRTVMGRNAPGNDELCATIRWMAGPEGKQPKAPSLRELIRAVYINRKDKADSGPEIEGCALCHRGWLDCPGDKNDPDYLVAAPCLCSAGMRVMDKVKDYRQMSSAEADGLMAIRKAGVNRAKQTNQTQTGNVHETERPASRDAGQHGGR